MFCFYLVEVGRGGGRGGGEGGEGREEGEQEKKRDNLFLLLSSSSSRRRRRRRRGGGSVEAGEGRTEGGRGRIKTRAHPLHTPCKVLFPNGGSESRNDGGLCDDGHFSQIEVLMT